MRLFLICLFAVAAAFYLGAQKPFQLIELKMLDYRFQLRGKSDISKDIVLVAIDEKDTELLGRWPWPRKYHADLIQILNMYGAKTIGYDILFTEPDKDNPGSDGCLVDAAKDSGNVCFPMAFGVKGQKKDLLPMDGLHKAACAVGFVNVYPDIDGMIRRTRLDFSGKPALGLALLCQHLGIALESLQKASKNTLTLATAEGDRIKIPLDRQGRMMINYAGATTDWQWLHFVEIILAFMDQQKGEKPSFDPNIFKGKIVLVGSTHTGMPDIIETPFGSSYGVELHANLINSVLQHKFLHPLPWAYEIATYLAFTIFCVVVLCCLRPLKGILFSAIVVLVFFSIAYALFVRYGIWIKVTQPVIGLIAIYSTTAVHHFIIVERKERAVRKAFQHYVSPAVVSKLAKNPEALELGGETRELTILFSDIRDFTAISESLSPDDLGQMLNEYFNSMTSSVFTFGGTLDKFIGDAIMAIYGAPVELEEHPLCGCLSALSMISKLEAFNGGWGAENQNPIRIGIGLNTGIAKVGNYGSKKRFDYTAIGDNVNLSSRMEGLTKKYAVPIIISESTYTRVKSKLLCRPLDVVMVKGYSKPLKIYELIGDADTLPVEEKARVDRFMEGLDLYQNKQWNAAQQFFRNYMDCFPNDKPARIFFQRSDHFSKTPPPDDWDGVYSHRSK